MEPTTAPAGTLCQPHRDRAHVRIPAVVLVAGTAMCKTCFQDKSPPVAQKLFNTEPQAARSNGAKAFGYRLNRWPVPPGNPPKRRGYKGEWAMTVARIYPQSIRGGTGNRDEGLKRARGKFGRTQLRMARIVLLHSPELADAVSSGAITLKKAFRLVQKEKASSATRHYPDAPYTHITGTKGQKAMALAMRFPGGIWRGDAEAKKYVKSGGFCDRFLKAARFVLRYSPQLAAAVLQGDTTLDKANLIVRRAKQEARRLRMLQSAGRFQMHRYPG
jgi:hypothetical protein